MRAKLWFTATALLACAAAGPVWAGSAFTFSTGAPDRLMAMASRPSSAGKIEIEAADDFLLGSTTRITSASFTGLLPTNASLSDVADVRIEIYRVFPKDSTSPPNDQVPTRANSPSDVAFAERSASGNTLAFTTSVLSSSFSALNSVLNGIHPIPGFHTGGDGSVTGEEFRFDLRFLTPLSLPSDHYFFVPQVQLTNGDFFWLSAPKPIGADGTPFMPDLQTWIRNEDLDPNWLRVGMDIVGGDPPPAFNAAFTLGGQTVPEPGSVIMLSLGSLGVLALVGLRRNRKQA